MTTYETQVTEWLREPLGHEAHFREGQWEAIAALVEKRQRMLVVQRTGWAKGRLQVHQALGHFDGRQLLQRRFCL